jgi:hypothetical protein
MDLNARYTLGASTAKQLSHLAVLTLLALAAGCGEERNKETKTERLKVMQSNPSMSFALRRAALDAVEEKLASLASASSDERNRALLTFIQNRSEFGKRKRDRSAIGAIRTCPASASLSRFRFCNRTRPASASVSRFRFRFCLSRFRFLCPVRCGGKFRQSGSNSWPESGNPRCPRSSRRRHLFPCGS